MHLSAKLAGLASSLLRSTTVAPSVHPAGIPQAMKPAGPLHGRGLESSPRVAMIRRRNPCNVGCDCEVNTPESLSENELRGDLSDARRRLHGPNHPERRSREQSVRIAELRVIEGIEELSPDLQRHAFPDSCVLV